MNENLTNRIVAQTVRRESNEPIKQYRPREGRGAGATASVVVLAAVAASSVLGVPGVARSTTVQAVVEQEVDENRASARIQERIDELAEDTDAMAGQYRASLANVRQLEIYNRQLEALIAGQREEAGSLREQIEEVTVIGRQIMPHMEEMIVTLEKFVELDVPFLFEERAERVAALRELMERADVTISERYRRILEAYQIENEYGWTIEAYRGDLETDGRVRTVDFLRIGRVALLYQTLDESEAGIWNQAERSWQPVDGYRIAIREGLRMARKQRAPDLVEIPLPAAEVIR